MNLLFDLDGTLTDPELGITRSIQYALHKLGRSEQPPREALRRYIGPPLRRSFAELLDTRDESRLDAAMAAYRQRFADIGIFENAVYPEVPGGLATLCEGGHRLWVATAKPEVYARRIIDHFNLAPMFQRIYGSELSGENSEKSDLISSILDRERLKLATVFVIGDRGQDILAGRANGTRTIGVLWGYGTEEEIRGAQPDLAVNSMAALIAGVEAFRNGGR